MIANARLRASLLCVLPLLILAFESSCSFGVNPNKGRFSCAKDADCGQGYVCIAQKNAAGGRCFKAGECTPEVCNGKDDDCDGVVDDLNPPLSQACDTGLLGECKAGHQACVSGATTCVADHTPVPEVCNGKDDDCDGQVDEDFDLATDDLHCGSCDTACASGTHCRARACYEANCQNGLDDDQNGKTDCEDPACLDQPCSAQDATLRCGVVDLALLDAGVDAGIDGGDQDAGVDAGDLDAGLDAGDQDAGAVDAGAVDAGTPDAGPTLVPACVPPEQDCANGLDDDGDSRIDCADPDCAGLTCVDGGNCQQGSCQ